MRTTRENKKLYEDQKKLNQILREQFFYIGETMAADFGKMSEME